MKKFQKVTQVNKFLMGGVNLALPQDLIPAGQYQILRNIRSYTDGEIRSRPGITQVNAAAIVDTNVHSGKELNDSTGLFSQSFAIALGAGTNLYIDGVAHNSFAQVTGTQGIGYSGSPLTFVPFRPNQSPNPWLYIGDANKNSKLRVDGLAYRQGIIPPNAPPTGVIGAGTDPNPTISAFQTGVLDSGLGTGGGWLTDGTVFVGTGHNGSGFTDTAAAFIMDTGVTPGWASVAVTAPGDGHQYQPGQLTFVTNETVTMDSVYPAMNRTTSIDSITYDAGSTGPATIVMHNARKNVVANSVIQFTGTGEYARIQAVSIGKDGLPSIRVNTVSTYTAGAGITGAFSWRAFFLNNHAGGSWTFQFVTLATGGASIPANATVTGTAAKPLSLDLSSIGGRPLQDTDFLNFTAFLDPLASEVQYRIFLGSSPVVSSIGTNDYYLVTIRNSDFASVTTGATAPTTVLLAQQRKIQRDIISSTPITPDLSPSLQFQRLITKVAKLTAAGQVKRANRVQARLDRLSTAQQIGLLPDGGGGPIGGGGGGTGGSGTGGGSGGSGGGGHHHHGGSGGGTGGGGTGGGSTGGPGPGTGAPSSGTIAVGASQFADIRVQIKDVARIGTDASLNWANVVGIGIQATFTNSFAFATGATAAYSSWWVGGTFGPTAGPTSTGASLTPYLYRCGFRSSLTGARSNPGPATRNGVTPNNSQVQMLVPSPALVDPQVDKVDVFRFGGSLNEWHYIGSTTPGGQFNDSLPDIEVASMPLMMSDLVAPFPILDIPRSGTCNVSGTMVTFASGSNFNVNWDQGTEILINGISQTIYRVISASLLEIITNAGNLTGTTFELPDPIIVGQPLPVIWGPFGTGKFGTVMFGVGSNTQPEALFWTNADDPDSAGDTNHNEVTSPSEPLINGFMYNGRAGVFSSERLFLISEAFDPITNFQYFTTDEVPNSKGLWSRWAMCVTPAGVAFLGKDGLYITQGGAPTQISANLYPIFPHDGIAGITVGIYQGVDMTQTNNLRLQFIDGRLEFWYKDLGGGQHTWICKGLETGNIAWESNDDYTPACNFSFPGEGAAVHTRYLCGSDGRLYKSANQASDGASSAIACRVKSRADDQGDSRLLKKYGDGTIDANTNGVVLSVTWGFNLFETTAIDNTQSNSDRVPPLVYDFPTGVGGGITARNVGVDITWSSSTQTVFLYEWQPNYSPKDDSTFKRATDFDNLGSLQPKFIQGIRLWADTLNVARTIAVQGDNGTNGLMQTNVTLSNVQQNGESVVAYPNDSNGWTPFIAHTVRLQPTDANQWELWDYEWVYEPAPEAATQWTSQFTTFDYPGFCFIRDFNIAYFSTTNLTLVVTYDDNTSTTYNTVMPSSSNLYKKAYFPSVAKKFKAASFSLTSTAPFRLMLKDTSIRVRPWGIPQDYRIVLPFGDMSRGTADAGARV